MKLRGPYLTLVAGLAAAAAIGAMSVNATDTAIEKAANNQAAPRNNANTPGGEGATTPPDKKKDGEKKDGEKKGGEEAKEVKARTAVYAGRVKGGGATLAVSIKDGKAIAYICDGRRVEAWLSGTVKGDQVVLKDGADAGLNGKITGNRLAGTVFVKKKNWTFDIKSVKKPSGLYQAASQVAGARVVGSWIMLENRELVGVVVTDGEPGPAPAFDSDTGIAKVDGGNLVVMPVGPN